MSQPAVHAIDAVALSAALLLLVSGIAKLRAPAPAAALLATLHPPVFGAAWAALWRHVPHRGAVRGIGAVEVAAGLSAIAVGARWTYLALAGLYLIFTAVVLLSMAHGSRVSCGCFGAADAPLGRAHLGVDVVALVASGWAAVTGPAAPGAVAGLPHLSTTVALGLAVQVLLLAWLGYLCSTALPGLAAARRRLIEETT